MPDASPALTDAGTPRTLLFPVLPCADLARSRAFYARLGLEVAADHGDYLRLAGGGLELHLRALGPEEALDPAHNPGGVYLRVEPVDAFASRFTRDELIHPPKRQPWDMYEFALSDPDGALVRVGWPQRPGVG